MKKFLEFMQDVPTAFHATKKIKEMLDKNNVNYKTHW